MGGQEHQRVPLGEAAQLVEGRRLVPQPRRSRACRARDQARHEVDHEGVVRGGDLAQVARRLRAARASRPARGCARAARRRRGRRAREDVLVHHARHLVARAAQLPLGALERELRLVRHELGEAEGLARVAAAGGAPALAQLRGGRGLAGHDPAALGLRAQRSRARAAGSGSRGSPRRSRSREARLALAGALRRRARRPAAAPAAGRRPRRAAARDAGRGARRRRRREDGIATASSRTAPAGRRRSIQSRSRRASRGLAASSRNTTRRPAAAGQSGSFRSGRAPGFAITGDCIPPGDRATSRLQREFARTRRRAMELGLAGKGVIVTGASRGIGRAIALAFAREGASVAICARGADGLEQAAGELRALGGKVHAATCDIADRAALEAFLARRARGARRRPRARQQRLGLRRDGQRGGLGGGLRRRRDGRGARDLEGGAVDRRGRRRRDRPHLVDLRHGGELDGALRRGRRPRCRATRSRWRRRSPGRRSA